MNTEQLFNKIKDWHHARNLIHGSNDAAQYGKLHEEMGELYEGIRKQDEAEISDAIGDMVVVLTNIAERHGLTVQECIEGAWHEIKDRKGRMIDGIFVKE